VLVAGVAATVGTVADVVGQVAGPQCGVLQWAARLRFRHGRAARFHDPVITLSGLDALRARIGQDLGTSSWHLVTQERIQAFADATEDWERIHVDPVRAAETPFGTTIAHGLYTLSLGPRCLYEIFEMTGHSLGLNYGFDRVRFLSPVPVDSAIRMTAHLLGTAPLEGGARFRIRQTFEIRGATKPACVAESIIAYFD
jgi:acyl dehydratase